MSISALVEIAKHGISEGYENIDVLAGFIAKWLNTNANELRENLVREILHHNHENNENITINSVIRNVAEAAIYEERAAKDEERRQKRKSRDRSWDEVKSVKRGGKSKKRVKRKTRKTKRK
jgi:hypothetical protein